MIERFIFIRHGETDWNREGRIQGKTDVPLSEAGRQQVRTLTSALQHVPIDGIWSSPQSRASETAKILGTNLSLPVEIDPDLREIDCGDWEGKVIEDVIASDRSRFDAWMSDAAMQAPGGESRIDVTERAARSIARIEASKAARVMVVSHAATIRAMASKLLDISVLTTNLFALDAASISIVTYWPVRRAYRLEKWNGRSC
ncbi:MAG: histidine phosphatase family protein [Acidobacteriota bacterium]